MAGSSNVNVVLILPSPVLLAFGSWVCAFAATGAAGCAAAGAFAGCVWFAGVVLLLGVAWLFPWPAWLAGAAWFPGCACAALFGSAWLPCPAGCAVPAAGCAAPPAGLACPPWFAGCAAGCPWLAGAAGCAVGLVWAPAFALGCALASAGCAGWFCAGWFYSAADAVVGLIDINVTVAIKAEKIPTLNFLILNFCCLNKFIKSSSWLIILAVKWCHLINF